MTRPYKYLEKLMEMIIIKIQQQPQEIQDQSINNQEEEHKKNNILAQPKVF